MKQSTTRQRVTEQQVLEMIDQIIRNLDAGKYPVTKGGGK